MEFIIIRAIIVHDRRHIENFPIRVNEDRCMQIKFRLLHERKKIVKIIKEYKEMGLIKSVAIPKNKKLKPILHELVEAKRTIDTSIKRIDDKFFS